MNSGGLDLTDIDALLAHSRGLKEHVVPKEPPVHDMTGFNADKKALNKRKIGK